MPLLDNLNKVTSINQSTVNPPQILDMKVRQMKLNKFIPTDDQVDEF
jgi:hypothetical protein